MLALSTGARQGEILSLSWMQFDLEREAICLEDTKNNERRAVPLVGHAKELIAELHAQRRQDTDLVFPRPDGVKPTYIVTDWKNALKVSGASAPQPQTVDRLPA